MIIDTDEATTAQNRAAHPAHSTWVSANAGSGKTRVLTDRVARLLLNGTDPQKILCLTYTNAAAAEMQNRLFERLGKWAMMANEDLQNALAALGEDRGSLSLAKLRQARTLFASALETPGGLKIQTIHAFCDALLRRFPLEAGLSPQFEILEDRQAKNIRAEILEHLAEGQYRKTFETLATFYTGGDIDTLLHSIVEHHRLFARRPEKADFGLKADLDAKDIAVRCFEPKDVQTIDYLIPHLQASDKSTDQNLAKIYQAFLQETCPVTRLKLLIDAHLDKTRFEAKLKGPPTADISKAHPKETETIKDIMQRVEKARDVLTSYMAYTRAIALHDFATPFLDAYTHYKLTHGKLDYQDLIEKSLALLQNSTMADWVLYRLDGGIDHILVDEAQDTSADQWRLIQTLAEDFTSGESAGNTTRTIFIVGDEKQSIYSFQGADPQYFNEMQDWFGKRLAEIDQPLLNQDLLFSFRSAEPILNLVDTIFAGGSKSGMTSAVKHHAFDPKKPGRVELWPLIPPASKPDNTPWFQPLDRPAENDPRHVLAYQIAEWVKTKITSGQQIKTKDGIRPVKSGDILILVQSRSTLFRAILKELKIRGLDVAGADRLEIGQELAVRDILSLLKFSILPEDDLSLAEALRSPLFNLSETALFSLAHGRTGTLWQSLSDQANRFPATKNILDDIRAKADWMRPFEFINHILIAHKGRENLLARLGKDVEDGIDEFLSQALRYEQTESPTLTGFLNWFSTGKVEIKREMDNSAGQIRVMTVHAAKGLEAPVVILPDTVGTRYRDRTDVLELTEGSAGWKTTDQDRHKVEQNILEKNREKTLLEKWRLLYVALTRAESWLIVCGAGKLGKDPALNWYHLVQQGMQHADAQKTEEGLVLQNKYWITKSKASSSYESEKSESVQSLPDWLIKPASSRKPHKETLSPSHLGGLKMIMSDTEIKENPNTARRGTLIHLLLEHLPNHPKAQWKNLSVRLLKAFDHHIKQDEIDNIYKHICRVLETDALKWIFAPDTLAEVTLTADIPALDGQKIYGTLDRLVVSDAHITAIDFKSNTGVPQTAEDTPDGILRQMGAYLSALEQIYPNCAIEIAILWTETCTYMPLPHKLVKAALNFETSP